MGDILHIDNSGEFPNIKSGGRPSKSKWQGVFDEVNRLQFGISHVRVLVENKSKARSLISSCFEESRRMGYRTQTRTEIVKDGIYVYIRKIEN